MKVKSAISAGARLVLICLLLTAAPVGASAQTAAEGTKVPNPAFSEMLIKNTIIALNQANLTGNYSVLRELGTPAFQAKNSSARLSQVFAKLRRDKIDMSGIVLLAPTLSSAQRRKNQMRLTGFFESKPIRIRFDAAYLKIGGKMRLHGLAVRAGTEVAAPEIRGGEKPAARSDFGVSP
jgi:hypothetical protein